MIKKILLSLICLVYTMQTYSMTRDQIYESSTGINYKKNNFGDIFPLWQDILSDELFDKLSKFIAELKVKEPGVPFIISVPHEKAEVLASIKRAGFTLQSANDETTDWIMKNGSSIPACFTAIGGAQVIVLKEGKILAIEEKTRKGMLNFPAGCVEPGELTRTAAVRELKEELGLTINPNKLKLIALANRVKVNNKGASNYNHFFLAQNVEGEIEIDPSEVAQAFWVPIKDLLEGEFLDHIEGKKITPLLLSPFIHELANHIKNGCKESRSLTLLDCRQWRRPTKDLCDKMHIEFIAQQDIAPIEITQIEDK